MWMGNGGQSCAVTVTRQDPHGLAFLVIFLFLKGDEVSIEKMLRPQASYCAKNLVFDIFTSKTSSSLNIALP